MEQEKINRLTLVQPSGNKTKDGTKLWLAICDCGSIIQVRPAVVKNGNTKSCGCYRKELTSIMYKSPGACKRKYNDTRHKPTYNSWKNMLTRCNDINYRDYKNYGGRGISVCSEWYDYDSFLKDMGVRPEHKSLDRIDVNGNYNRNNCRWATKKEQARNRRNNLLLSHDCAVKSAAEWAEELGMNYHKFLSLIHSGKTLEELLQFKC